ncbi:MAG: MMPL family transporter [Planctomycetaceae bacterium]|nr:MMPL family transporter [Planctomycetales bacterium]MCB9939954.1 MMPL family transporter [Planctomycetaceae bacterium]
MDIAQRRFRLVMIYGVVLLPVVVWQAMQAVQTTANSPLDWAPADFPARIEYDNFTRTFGSGDVVVLSWEGCTINLPQLDQLAKALRRDPEFYDRDDWLFDQVATGREMVQQLVAGRVEQGEAVRRLRGTMIGPDGVTTCVVIGFTKRGLAERARLVPLIQQATERCCNIPADQLHLAGPVIDGLSVDLASASALQKLAVPSAFVVFAVGWYCLGSWRANVIVFGISAFCQIATLALISLCGDTMSALLIVLPPLVQVLALAGGIHLVNYYRSAAPSDSPSQAAQRAFQIGWLPCLLSAGTTAVGMSSLMVSELTPIRSFGAYSTAGLILTTGLILLLVPATLAIWRVAVAQNVEIRSNSSRSGRSHRPRIDQFVDVLARHHGVVTIGLLLAMVAAGWSMSRLNTSVRIETLFGRDSRILSDYRWLESHVAPLVPIEIVITFEDSSGLSLQQRLAEVRRIDSGLRACSSVSGSLSALTFLPTLPTCAPTSADEAVAMHRFAHLTLVQTEQQWAKMRLVSNTNSRQQWRIRGIVSALEQTDYGVLLSEIRQRLAAIASDGESSSTPHFAIEATGIMPLVHDVQRQLLVDLRSSFLLAFLTITIVMTVMQGSVGGGLVAMLPNIFPTLLIFGLLGWLEIPIDIGSVMSASIALGVAVDDTLHFLTTFQRSLASGASRRQAVRESYRHCGRAMWQSSLICGAGMAVFALSDFVPTARFAWMMVALFAAAIVGDLMLLPALLLGPFGKLWETCESRDVTVDRTSDNEVRNSQVVPPPHSDMAFPARRLVVPRRSSREGEEMPR